MMQTPVQAAKDAAKEMTRAFTDHQCTCVCAYVRFAETQFGILATIDHFVDYKLHYSIARIPSFTALLRCY
jgi:hypothetical protein